MSEGGDYKIFGIVGKNPLFGFTYCENDRLWRKMLGLTPDRYNKNESYTFDECSNAFIKPHKPLYLDILSSLHKKSDFEQ